MQLCRNYKQAILQCFLGGTEEKEGLRKKEAVRLHSLLRDLLSSYFLSECRTVSRYMLKYKCIYVYKKRATFLMLIFTKLINDLQNYMYISYSEFHQTRMINVERTDRNSFTPLSKVQLSVCRFSLNSRVNPSAVVNIAGTKLI
jgi:hypothetical protein